MSAALLQTMNILDAYTDRVTPPVMCALLVGHERLCRSPQNGVDQTHVVKCAVLASAASFCVRWGSPFLTDGVSGAVDGVAGRTAVDGPGDATCGHRTSTGGQLVTQHALRSQHSGQIHDLGSEHRGQMMTQLDP